MDPYYDDEHQRKLYWDESTRMAGTVQYVPADQAYPEGYLGLTVNDSEPWRRTDNEYPRPIHQRQGAFAIQTTRNAQEEPGIHQSEPNATEGGDQYDIEPEPQIIEYLQDGYTDMQSVDSGSMQQLTGAGQILVDFGVDPALDPSPEYGDPLGFVDQGVEQELYNGQELEQYPHENVAEAKEQQQQQQGEEEDEENTSEVISSGPAAPAIPQIAASVQVSQARSTKQSHNATIPGVQYNDGSPDPTPGVPGLALVPAEDPCRRETVVIDGKEKIRVRCNRCRKAFSRVDEARWHLRFEHYGQYYLPRGCHIVKGREQALIDCP
ncbi:hypothetical protein CORC01_06205 [Colletotrichum orchidophilum]|uniref:C2H2-type domain-containing protein n=1 Tax=Colletotrichum orchidophilum TaxID=1209926 RepID=A0A1G4BAI2_9PEZI|nr:uncharacterized protein CORC01_06205 [Colletotrichum orchidophilum]OHE98414.1 hypothetical protein CORC01_06205 [Colletotrichum orchidophilum]